MRCDRCPCPDPSPNECPGEDHRRHCTRARGGDAATLAWLVEVATGVATKPGPAIDWRLNFAVETCPMGSRCGCRARPCGHPARPELVSIEECRLCVTRGDWEAGVELAW